MVCAPRVIKYGGMEGGLPPIWPWSPSNIYRYWFLTNTNFNFGGRGVPIIWDIEQPWSMALDIKNPLRPLERVDEYAIYISIYELWKLNPLNQFLVVEQLNTWLCLSVLPPLLWDLTSDWFQWLSMVIRIVIMIIRWVRMVEKMVRMIISVIIMGAVVIRKDK